MSALRLFMAQGECFRCQLTKNPDNAQDSRPGGTGVNAL